MKQFEQFQGLDTALYKNVPLPFTFEHGSKTPHYNGYNLKVLTAFFITDYKITMLLSVYWF